MEPAKFAIRTFVIGGAALYGCQQLLKNPEIAPSLNLVKTALEGSPGPLKNALLSSSISLNPRNLPSALAQVPAVIFQWAILPTLVKTASFSNAYFPVLTAPILIAIINAPITYAILLIVSLFHSLKLSKEDQTLLSISTGIFLFAITPLASYHLANKVPSFSMGKWSAALWSLNTTVIGLVLGQLGLQHLEKERNNWSPQNMTLAILAASLGMLAAGLLTAKGLWQAKELVKSHGSLLSAPLLAGLATGIGAPLSKKALTWIDPKSSRFYHGSWNKTSKEFDAKIRTLFVFATSFLITALFINRLTYRTSGYTLSYPKIFSLSALAAISSFYNFATVQKEMGWKPRTYNNPSPIKPEHFAEILEQVQQEKYAEALDTLAKYHPNFDEPLVADLLLQLKAINSEYYNGLGAHIVSNQGTIQGVTLSSVVLSAYLDHVIFKNDLGSIFDNKDSQTLKNILDGALSDKRYDAKTISFLLRNAKPQEPIAIIDMVNSANLVDYKGRKITSEDVAFYYYRNKNFDTYALSERFLPGCKTDRGLSALLSNCSFGDIKGFFQVRVNNKKLTIAHLGGPALNFNAIRVLAHLENLETRYFLFKELAFTKEYLQMTKNTNTDQWNSLIQKLQGEKVCDAQVLAMVIEQLPAEMQANLLNALENTTPPVNDLHGRPITKDEVEKAMWKPQPFHTPLTRDDITVATLSALWAGAMVAGVVAACILIPPAARFAWENKGAPLTLLRWSWSSTNKPLLASTIAATAGFALSNAFRRGRKSNLNYFFAILAGAFVSPLIARKAFGHQMGRWEGAAFAALGALAYYGTRNNKDNNDIIRSFPMEFIK